MNRHDRAIIVGIPTYPSLSPKLKGPGQDALDVVAWLKAANGGGLPAANIEIVAPGAITTPPATKAKTARPHEADVRNPLNELWNEAMAAATHGTGGAKLGRRLYIYVSGHGFARGQGKAALITANATTASLVHVNVSAWAEDIANADFFDEVVLWVDCCMADDITVRMEGGAPMASLTGQAARRFTAFAAAYHKQAVERNIDGRVRGVFTHTLLKGLRGGAVDPAKGVVTARQLEIFLETGMRDFLKPADLADASISSEPYVQSEDDAMEFGPSGLAPAKADVTIKFPAPLRGKLARVLGAPNFRVMHTVAAAPALWKIDLGTGAYALMVEQGDPQGFIVRTDKAMSVTAETA